MAASGSGCIVVTATAAILIAGRVYIARESHIDGHGVGLNRGQSHPCTKYNSQQANNDPA